MNLENEIKDVLNEKLKDGSVERIIGEQFEKAIKEAADDLFSWRGDVKKVIEAQLKSVMVPYIEQYDFSAYVTKLDSVLTEVMKHSLAENSKLLKNFESLMIPRENKDIEATELFEEFKKYVEHNIDTDKLEVDFDGEPAYEMVEVSMEVEYERERSWLKLERATILFECEKDESLNVAIPIHRFTNIREEWSIDYHTSSDLNGLRHLSSFEVFLMKLDQNMTHLVIDEDYETDEVEPDEVPEPSY